MKNIENKQYYEESDIKNRSLKIKKPDFVNKNLTTENYNFKKKSTESYNIKKKLLKGVRIFARNLSRFLFS